MSQQVVGRPFDEGDLDDDLQRTHVIFAMSSAPTPSFQPPLLREGRFANGHDSMRRRVRRLNTATLWPPNGQLVPVRVTGTIADELTGVDGATAAFYVIDEYGLVQPAGAVALLPDGSYAFTITLEASRRGQDLDGRQYQIVVGAADNAGNAGATSVVLTVPHDKRRL